MTVHEFARRLGIPPSKVRYYDRSGVVSGMRSEENNYRDYTPADALDIYNALMLRSFGMGVADTARVNRGCQLEEVTGWLDGRIAELEKTIELEKLRLARLRQMQEHFAYIDAGRSQVEPIVVQRNYEVWTFGKKEPLTEMDVRGAQLLAECLPYSYVALRIPEESLFSQKEGPLEVWAGLGILEENLQKCGLSLPKSIQPIGGDCQLGIWLEKEDPFSMTAEDFAPVFEEARRRKVTLTGDAVGRIYLSYNINGRHVHCCSIGVACTPPVDGGKRY